MRTSSIDATNLTQGDRRGSVTAQSIIDHAVVNRQTTNEAASATNAELSMTLAEGLKLYPKAIGWSILLSTAIIMEGFDIVLITSLFGLPAFQQRYGTKDASGSYQVSAAWQTGLSNGALIGEILGLFISGIVAERIGYKRTMIGALVMVTCFIFIVFFAHSLPMLLVGEIFCGIPWGVFQTLTTTYAAEVCPVALRAYLTTYVNLCWVLGQLFASGVLRSVATSTTAIGYKLPYGLQWMWPVPLIIGISFAPESPWWLVRKGRNEKAKAQLLRLTSRAHSDSDIDKSISMMIYTNEFEKATSAGTTYRDCLKGVDLRRTEIVCIVWAVQILCGASAMMGYSIYFFEQAGLDTSNSFSLSLGQYGLGVVGTLVSWFLMIKFGRRQLYLWGQASMLLILIVTGLLSIVPSTSHGVQWGIGAMTLLYTFTYDATIGPVCYSLVAELSSTRLRNKTVVLARNLYNITGIVANVLTPHMLNPRAWNWGAKAAFFWAGSCATCLVWTYFRLPEPKGRTYAELDMLFHAKVPARKFASTIVEPFSAGIHPTIVAEKETNVTVQKVMSNMT